MIRTELRAKRFELSAQLFEVVYLAVEYNGQGAIGRRHRLLAPGDIKNGKTAKAKKYAAVRLDQKAFVIRAAMLDALRHPLQHGRVTRAKKAGNTAHGLAQ